jgi:3'-phosphoadenosine 5'-phosphosulfate sulfotransferase (PAPS reductase)/FAD synthetase
MIQIQIRWDSKNPKDVALVDKLQRGFDKIGCWSCPLIPEGSIYKRVLTYDPDGTNTNKEEFINGEK